MFGLDGVFGHGKRSVSKTLSRVDLLEIAVFPTG